LRNRAMPHLPERNEASVAFFSKGACNCPFHWLGNGHFGAGSPAPAIVLIAARP
jgi:hypothetical protein